MKPKSKKLRKCPYCGRILRKLNGNLICQTCKNDSIVIIDDTPYTGNVQLYNIGGMGVGMICGDILVASSPTFKKMKKWEKKFYTEKMIL